MTSTPNRGGRRSAARTSRVNVTVVLAVLLPLLAGGAALLVHQEEPTEAAHPPARTTLTTATLVCPSGLPGAADAALTTVADEVSGTVTTGLGAERSQTEVATRRVTTLREQDAFAIIGEDATAPGLVAGRSGGAEAALTACLPPGATRWFTGVGAGAAHRSVLELTNPDAGTAVADVTVLGRDGVVDAPRLRGVSVRGGRTVRLDLASLVPRTDELALQVVTARGRLGASVVDRIDEVGTDVTTQDWLPAQEEPATRSVLLGLAPGSGSRTLAVANPGADEVVVDLRIIDTESVFAPDGAEPIRVPPQSVVRVPVTSLVDGAVADGAVGVELTSTGPVTASLRSVVRGDLSVATGTTRIEGEAAVLLPGKPAGASAKRQVVLADATSAGLVTVVARDAKGREVGREKVEIRPGQGAQAPVPGAAVLVEVTPRRTAVAGAVVVSGSGAAMLPLTSPVRDGLVPDVRPGLS